MWVSRVILGNPRTTKFKTICVLDYATTIWAVHTLGGIITQVPSAFRPFGFYIISKSSVSGQPIQVTTSRSSNTNYPRPRPDFWLRTQSASRQLVRQLVNAIYLRAPSYCLTAPTCHDRGQNRQQPLISSSGLAQVSLKTIKLYDLNPAKPRQPLRSFRFRAEQQVRPATAFRVEIVDQMMSIGKPKVKFTYTAIVLSNSVLTHRLWLSLTSVSLPMLSRWQHISMHWALLNPTTYFYLEMLFSVVCDACDTVRSAYPLATHTVLPFFREYQFGKCGLHTLNMITDIYGLVVIVRSEFIFIIKL